MNHSKNKADIKAQKQEPLIRLSLILDIFNPENTAGKGIDSSNDKHLIVHEATGFSTILAPLNAIRIPAREEILVLERSAIGRGAVIEESENESEVAKVLDHWLDKTGRFDKVDIDGQDVEVASFFVNHVSSILMADFRKKRDVVFQEVCVYLSVVEFQAKETEPVH